MIETVAQLTALMISIQAWMPTLPSEHTWAVPVKYTITDAMLLQNKPTCCRYLTYETGQIMRIANYVWLVK